MYTAVQSLATRKDFHKLMAPGEAQCYTCHAPLKTKVAGRIWQDGISSGLYGIYESNVHEQGKGTACLRAVLSRGINGASCSFSIMAWQL